MNLHRLLRLRATEGRPIRVGVIGCGKFAAMFLAQAPATPGLQVVAIADLAPDRARARLRDIGWAEERIAATSIVDDAGALLAATEIEVVVEATGDALAGVDHALRAIDQSWRLKGDVPPRDDGAIREAILVARVKFAHGPAEDLAASVNSPLPTNCSSSNVSVVSRPRTNPVPTRSPICRTAFLHSIWDIPSICFLVTDEFVKL